MALISPKPTTPSLRARIQVDYSNLWKGRPLKTLVFGLKKTGGRNNLGRITIWQRGGGHKRLYRIIDFKRNKYDINATVERIEYDPNRSAFIALLKYDDAEYSYIIAPQKLKIGDKVFSSFSNLDLKIGNSFPIKLVPNGTFVHNVELSPGKGGQLARSAGSYVQIMGKGQGYAQVKLVSGEIRKVLIDCMVTIGIVSNSDHKNINLGKAGRSRWLGRRSGVRGVAMNPVDHPHGGGEGKTSGGRHPVTPWGKGTKGNKTRKNKKTSKYIIKNRKK